MEHRGELLEKAVRASDVSITKLCKILKRDRGTLYNWFDKPNLSYDVMLNIGKIIKHDFTNELKHSTEFQQFQQVSEPTEEYGRVQDFKDKYLDLLEEQNRFLREKTLTQDSLLEAIDKLISALNPKKALDNLGDDLKESMNKNSLNISEKLEMIAQAIVSH
jgi:hypothetical protein